MLNNTLTEAKLSELEKELKESFTSFYNFALGLLETLSKDNGNLKFAVVNMQIALELFLKYYFIKKRQPEKVLLDEPTKIRFKEFSSVLKAYFSNTRWSYMKKKHLTVIMESRNAIVHRGKHNEWNSDLADYLIICSFFIQGTLKSEFGEALIFTGYSEHSLSKNPIWRKGAEDFAKDLASKYNDKVFNCPFCYAKSIVDKEFFNFDENAIEGFQCLSCFQDLQLDYQIGVINCCVCNEKAFIIDILNEQSYQLYDGLCLSCDNKMHVRKCLNCEKFYFNELIDAEVKIDGKFLCSTGCSIMYEP